MEWQDQATWTTPAPAPCAAWAGWHDEGFAFAIRQGLPAPGDAGTVVAIEPVRDAFDSQSAPLLLRLEWQGGRGQVRVLERSRTSPQLVSRAASDGMHLTWEVLVPWEWLLWDKERPRKDMQLRWGLLAEAVGALAEFGRGLSPLLDKAGLIRLRLLDTRPAPPAAGEQRGK